MFLCLTILSLLFDTHRTYSSNLPHTGLEKIPASKGKDVQLRCTQVVEKMQGDVIDTPYGCNPQWSDDCYHVWSKNGEIIDIEDSKYDTKSSITFEYCENFEWTSDLIKGFGQIVNENDEKYSSREMACFASALTIKNVDDSDFGQYSCNLSQHKGEVDEYYRGRFWVQNITLYNIEDKSVKQPEKVQFFESAYPKLARDKLLIQCVATGGELTWMVDTETRNDPCIEWYGGTSIKCLANGSVPLEKLKELDYWRCFNYSESRHSPLEGVTESFLYIQNICELDIARISCGLATSSKADRMNNSTYVTRKVFWGDDFERPMNGLNYESRDAMTIAGVTVVPLIVAALIVFGILAIVRSTMCSCCRDSSVNPSQYIAYQLQ